jgi:hypothetical protein
MNSGKPPFLYHGSRSLLTELTPRPARGVGPEKDKLCAVYASHVRDFALVFALPIVPNENGMLAYWMDFDPQNPEVIVLAGHLDLNQRGYLYRVPSASFEVIDELQWVSTVPVEPLDYEIIDPTPYAHWVRKAAEVEKETLLGGQDVGISLA